jgi:cytochrome b
VSDGALEPRRVWDLPTRTFHWMLVALFGFSWWSAETGQMDWHQKSGLILCWLVLFRIMWGLIGGSTARFTQFLKGPKAVITYLRSSEPWQGLGHNPIGGWSSLILILLIALQISTGLFSVDVDGIESGPLSYFVDFDQGRVAAEVHHLSFNFLLLLASVHIIAILTYQFLKKQNLIKPMILGSDGGAGEALIAAPLWRFLLTLIVTGAMTYAVSKGFRF